MLDSRARPAYRTAGPVKLSSLATRFCADLLAVGKAPATLTAYRSDIQRFLGWLGRDDTRAFTRDAVLRWAAHLQQEGYAQAGCQRRLCALSEFGRWMVRRGDLERSPLDGVPRPRRPRRLPRPIPHSRAMAVLPGATPAEMAMVGLMRFAGLRVGEVAALCAEDVDLGAGRLILRQGKGRRDRALPIIQQLAAVLGPVLPAAGPIFRAPRGGPLTRKAISRRLDALAQRAGVPRFTPHQLRHTFATEAIRAGVRPRTLQQLMGHSDLATTALYVEVAGIDIEEAARALEAAGSGFCDVPQPMAPLAVIVRR